MPKSRQIPGPTSKLVKLCMRAVASGMPLSMACKAVGIPYPTMWTWIQIGEGKSTWAGRRSSEKRRRECEKVARMYDLACREREAKRIEDAIEAIRVAGEEGHRRTRITSITRPVVYRGQVVHGLDGQPVTYTEERREVEQETPDWRAAVALIEKLAPDRYGPRANVVVSGRMALREGEAEAVVAACSPEELAAIERGDDSVLQQVLERVRMERAG